MICIFSFQYNNLYFRIMKLFLKSPMFNVVLLAVYVGTLINKIKGIDHVYNSHAFNTHTSFNTGFNWGYCSGYMASIAVWMIGIVLMSIKIIKGKPAFNFIKR